MISKYAARRKNVVAAGAENTGDGVGWGGVETLYPAESWAPRGRAHEFLPSVTRVYCIKTDERIVEILSPSDRPIILVFRHQGLLRMSDGFTPSGAPNTRGCQFSTNMRLSEKVLDRGIITMGDKYKVVCALSNSVAFDDLE